MSKEIGSRLAALRKERGYSQETLAEELNVSRQAISKWERGEASPDTENLIALARLYQVSIDTLVGLAPVAEKNIAEEDKPEEASVNAEPETEFETVVGQANEQTPEAVKEVLNAPEAADNVASPAERISEQGSFAADVTQNEENTEDMETPYGLGLHFEDEKHRVHIYNGKITVTDKKDEVKNVGKDTKGEGFPSAIVAVITYLLVGFLLDAWHPGWLVFLAIPLAESIVTSIKIKDPAAFSYPVFVTLAFLSLGFFLHIWEYAWILYLTVPVYYYVCRKFKRGKKQ